LDRKEHDVLPAVVLCDIPRYEEIRVERLDQVNGLVDLDADPAAAGGG
jgi:hypothetical protein